MSQAQEWGLWRNGGTFDGAHDTAAWFLLVKPNTNLASPTTITAKTWRCTTAKNATSQGAGSLISRWYRAHNS